MTENQKITIKRMMIKFDKKVTKSNKQRRNQK